MALFSSLGCERHAGACTESANVCLVGWQSFTMVYMPSQTDACRLNASWPNELTLGKMLVLQEGRIRRLVSLV